MCKLTALSTMLILFLVFSSPIEVSAQIQDIKKKSSSNKSKRSSSSSSKSSSKKKSKSYSSSSFSSGSDIDADDVFGCLGSLFDAAGCLFSALENSNSSQSDYTSNDNYDYDYYEKDEDFEKNESREIDKEVVSNEENNTPIVNDNISENEPFVEITEKQENTYDLVKSNQADIPFLKDTIATHNEVNLAIRAHFDVSLHKGIDKNYVHVDYLPGVRATFDFFMFDFRFNVLTEYTDDFPDSFKSWEFLAMFNITAKQDYSVILGTGVHKEEFGDGSTFHEYYLGVKLPLKNNKDFVDIDTRFSTDYKTDAFPFFEFGGRYNVRFLNEKKVSGYITLGATYQNYYQSYDIWGIRGGVILNIH